MAIYLEYYRGGNIGNYIKNLFHRINFLPKGTIFIKPNLCARPPARRGENTDTIFIESLVDVLLSFNCKVMIGHTGLLGSPDRQYPFDEIIRHSKIKFIKPHNNVQLINLDKQEKEIVSYDGFDFEIPRILFEVDSYINVAKLKTHMQTGVSLTLKNQLGVLSQSNRIKIHMLGIDNPIAGLAIVLKPKISFIDGIFGMEGDGPHHGKLKRANFIFCGDDMVELDSFACVMIGFDFQKIKHIALAKKIGAGKFAHQSDIENYRNKMIEFKPAKNMIVTWTRIFVWPNKACPRCMVALNEAGKWIKKHPGLLFKMLMRNKRIDIIYGKIDYMDLTGKQKILGVGKCAEDFCRKNNIAYLMACPPRSGEIIKFLRDNLRL